MYVGARLDKNTDNRYPGRGPVQRRFSFVVFCVYVGARFDQSADNFLEVSVGCPMQRRFSFVVFCMYVCSCFDQKADRFRIGALNRFVQRRFSLAVFCMYVGACFNQRAGGAFIACPVQRRLALVVFRMYVGAVSSLEPPPACACLSSWTGPLLPKPCIQPGANLAFSRCPNRFSFDDGSRAIGTSPSPPY